MTNSSLISEMIAAGVNIHNMQEVFSFILAYHSGGNNPIDYEQFKTEVKDAVLNDIDELLGNLGQLEQALQSFSQLNTNVGLLSQEFTDLSTNVSGLIQSLGTINSQIENIEDSLGELSQLSQSLNTVSGTVNQLVTDVSGLNDSLEITDDQVNLLDQEVNSVKNSVSQINSKILTIESSLTTLSTAISTKAEKIYVDTALSAFQNGALKVYPTLTEANADIANINLNTKVEVLSEADGGSYYKTSSSATSLTKSPYDLLNTIKKILFSVEYPNLFNPTNAVPGYRINGVGQLSVVAGAKHTGFITVIPSEKVTISWSNTISDVPYYSFFTNKTDTTPILYKINSPATSPLTITVPDNAYFLVVNLKHNTAATEREYFKIEKGEVATPYKPYSEPIYQIFDTLLNDNIVRSDVIESIEARLPQVDIYTVSLSNGTGIIKSGDFDLGVKVFNTVTQTGNPVFNFNNDSYQGTQIRLNGDDVAPVRMMGATIGANHGYARSNLTLASHGKTVEDVGSVWTDGTNQWVIVQINSVNVLGITCRDKQLAYSTSVLPTLTHVSGAVHTGSFKPTSAVGVQWYSMLKNHHVNLTIDDKKITGVSGQWKFSNSVKIIESYDLMEKNAIAEWLIENGGKEVTSYNAASALNINHIHDFNAEGTDVISCNFFVYKNLNVAQDLMFTQSARLKINTDGPIKYYVPRSIAFTHETQNFDFSIPTVIDSLTIVNRIDFTVDKTESGKAVPDRLIMFNNTLGYAMGYLPILDADPSIRNTLTSKGIQISQSESKVYPYLVDGLTALQAGANYSCIAYRKYFKRPSEVRRTVEYDIHSEHGDFLFLDWHSGNFTDVIQLPIYMRGRTFEIIEVTSNLAVMTKVSTGHLAVKIGDVLNNARLILRFH